MLWRDVDESVPGESDLGGPKEPSRVGAFVATALVAGVLGLALLFGGDVVRAREAVRRTAGPPPIVQPAPTAALLEERVVERRFTGPTDLVERLADVPELGDVVRVADRFGRIGGDVVLDRKIIRREPKLVPLTRATVDTKFDHGAEDYGVAFGGIYEWENPREVPAEMRFIFPAPRGTESSAFHLTVGQTEVVGPDPKTGAYTWQGIVPASSRVTASVRYRAVGGKAYRYEPGDARAGEFRTRGIQAASVGSGSASPRDTNGASAVWPFEIQRSGPIALSFAREPEGVVARDRALRWAPLALALFAFGAWILRPERAWGATLVFGTGLALIAVASGYVVPLAALALGAAVAGIGGAKTLASGRGVFVAVSGALVALAPALEGHATLAVWGLGLLVLGPAVIRPPLKVPQRRRVYVA